MNLAILVSCAQYICKITAGSINSTTRVLVRILIILYCPCVKVKLSSNLVMNSAEVYYKMSVNEYPYIIVTFKVIDHVCSDTRVIFCMYKAVCRYYKGCFCYCAEVIVMFIAIFFLVIIIKWIKSFVFISIRLRITYIVEDDILSLICNSCGYICKEILKTLIRSGNIRV